MSRGILIGVFGLFFISLGQSARSQDWAACTEIGVYGGGSYAITDINPNKHFANSGFAGGLIYRYNLSKRHSFRATAFYGEVFGDDALSNQAEELNRNLNFESKIVELAIGYEINWFKYRIKDMKYPISPYFFYQIAYTRINPTTNYEGNEIALQPLGTEGQGTSLTSRRNYSLNQLTIPLGIGVKMNIKDRWAISMEYGIRKTFTDFLDDVSGSYVNTDVLRTENGPLAAELSDQRLDNTSGYNRGNPNNKDWYSFYGVMLTWKPFQKDVCDRMRGR